MDLVNRKKTKYIAIGYLIYSLTYLAISIILIDVTGWRGIYIAFHESTAILKILSILSGLLFINILLAWGSWRVHTLTAGRRTLLVISATAIAIIALIDSIQIWWSWLQDIVPPELSTVPVVGHSLIGLGYVFLAFFLMKVVKTTSRSQ